MVTKQQLFAVYSVHDSTSRNYMVNVRNFFQQCTCHYLEYGMSDELALHLIPSSEMLITVLVSQLGCDNSMPAIT